MAGFYNDGEQKRRPGVYIRIVNGGDDISAPAYPQVTPEPTPPTGDTDGITVAYDASGLATLAVPGGTVTHDGKGTVTLSCPTMTVTNDGAGNVTIGG